MTPEALNAIRQHTMTACRRIRARGEECAPVLLIYQHNGNMTALALPERKEIWKALQETYAKLPTTKAAVTVMEGWQAIALPGQPLPMRPSACPDRQEVLLVNLMTAGEQYLLTAEIHGTAIDEAEFIRCNGANFQGRLIRALQYIR